MKKILIILALFCYLFVNAQRPAITGGSYNIIIDTNSLSNRINNTDTKINNHLFSDNDTIIGNEVDSIWKSGLTYFIKKGANTFTLTDSAGGVDTDSQSIYLSGDTLYITRGNYVDLTPYRLKLYSENYDAGSFSPQSATGLNSISMGGGGSSSNGQLSISWGSRTEANGIASTAFGGNTNANGIGSTAFGENTNANGDNSTAIGNGTRAESYFETSIGSYNTSYTPISINSFEAADRLFIVGNGNGGTDADALTILKNGKTSIGYNNFETTTLNSLLQVSGGIQANLPVANQDSIIGIDANGEFYKMPLPSGGGSIDTTSLSDRINNLNTQIANHVTNDLDTVIGNEIDSVWKIGTTFFFKKGTTTFALKDSIGGGSSSIGDTTNDEWKSVGTNTMLNRLTTGALRTNANNTFFRDNGTVRIGGDLDLAGNTTSKLQIIHSGTTPNNPYAIITGSSTFTDPTGIFLRSIDSSYITSGHNTADVTKSNLIFDFTSTPRTEVMRIRADGRVGINSTIPLNTLDIGGDLRIRNIINSTNSSDSILVSSGGVVKKTPRINLSYVTPEMFGAVGDGITNDAVAIQNAINSNELVWFGTKNYLVNSTINIPANRKILGMGKSSVISTTANIPIINILGNNITIESLSFFGNSTGANQVGIDFVGNFAFSLVRHGNNITNCFFSNFGGSGVRATNVIGSSSGTNHEGAFIMSNSMFSNCNIGVNLLVRAEYCCINNCNIYNCTTGIVNTGGNNSVTGGQITGCVTGYSLLSGANDGHCTANGVKINHNTTNISNATTNGYTFEGCAIYAGNITSTGVGLLRFVGCDISYNGGNLTVTNAPMQFVNCVFATNPTTVTITGKQPLFINCFNTAGTTIYVAPGRTYTPSNVFSSNGTLFIPLGTTIESITILNTTANAITGGIRIGTTAGASDVIAALPIPANGFIEVNNADILKKAFSNVANQTLFVEAITSWNSASITLNIKLKQNVF